MIKLVKCAKKKIKHANKFLQEISQKSIFPLLNQKFEIPETKKYD